MLFAKILVVFVVLLVKAAHSKPFSFIPIEGYGEYSNVQDTFLLFWNLNISYVDPSVPFYSVTHTYSMDPRQPFAGPLKIIVKRQYYPQPPSPPSIPSIPSIPGFGGGGGGGSGEGGQGGDGGGSEES